MSKSCRTTTSQQQFIIMSPIEPTSPSPKRRATWRAGVRRPSSRSAWARRRAPSTRSSTSTGSASAESSPKSSRDHRNNWWINNRLLNFGVRSGESAHTQSPNQSPEPPRKPMNDKNSSRIKCVHSGDTKL